jgi:hypothetical protein
MVAVAGTVDTVTIVTTADTVADIRAFPDVTGLRLIFTIIEITFLTTVGSGNRHGEEAVLFTVFTTGVRAVTIGTPVTNAVDGAGTVVTVSGVSTGARLTSVLGLNGDNEIAGLETISAGNRARAPVAIVTFTVDGARNQFAVASGFISISMSAGFTTVKFGLGDGESASLFTSSAHIFVGASVILTEITFTVNGARSSIATFSLNFTIIVVTFKTTITSFGSDGEGSVDVTGGAGDRAGSEVAPLTFTVFGTRLGIASLGVFLSISSVELFQASQTTVGLGDRDGESLSLLTTTASLRASGEITPGTFTVDGASLSVTVAGLSGTIGMRARITLVVGGNRNVVSLGLETTTTGHVASVICGP